MNKSKVFVHFYLSTLFILLSFFLAHRYFAYPYLNLENEQNLTRTLSIYFIGGLSDFWIASLVAMLTGLLAICFSSQQIGRYFALTLLIFIFISILAHQAYVEFFRVQILPFHLRYIFDPDFIAANGVPVSVGILFLAGLALFLLGLYRVVLLFDFSRDPKHQVGLVVVLILLTPFVHYLNNRWKVNFFVPDQMRSNPIERLIVLAAKNPKRKKLNMDRLIDLVEYFHHPKSLNKLDEESLTTQLLFWKSEEFQSSKELDVQRGIFQKKLESGKKPMIIVLLLETARAYDFSAYQVNEQAKNFRLTPYFDALAQKGVLFERAYSTGTVTRAGQEAVWCGVFSSMFESLMRERIDLKFPCLPKRLDHRVISLWLHGGSPNFDNQLIFWKQQGVAQSLDVNSFPDDFKTGWGTSDASLFKASIEILSSTRSKSEGGFLLAQILSVSNHTPWTLPKDVPKELEVSGVLKKHPSYQTVHYVDWALGEFVKNLKRQKLWDDTLLIIVGDHGNKVRPFYKRLVYPRQHKVAEWMSRIVMLVSGGIIEQARQENKLPKRINQFVSQADVASFISELAQLNDFRLSDGLFRRRKKVPVVVQLESSYYFPEYDLEISHDEIPRVLGEFGLGSPQAYAIDYLRAYLEYFSFPQTNVNLKKLFP